MAISILLCAMLQGRALAATPVIWEGRVSASANDAEQTLGSTSTNLTSSDLELVTDAALQVVGIRFTNVTIPKGATISNAYVQFAADEVSTGTVSLTIAGEAADNSAIFTTAANNISSRATTTSPVAWSPPSWNVLDEAAAAQRTPDLSGAVQQIVNRNGWASGNALAIIINGSGKRVARAFDVLSGSEAPLLHVEYTAAADTTLPSTPGGLSGTAVSPTQINLSWTASTDNVAVTGYRVFRNGSDIGTTGTPSFSNTGLNPNTIYSYTVLAFDAAGNASGQSSSISVTTPNSTGAMWEGRISASANDAEQIIGGNSTNLNSSDLELVTDGSVQVVGMRFTNVTIPKGAQIGNAYVQFVTDEVSTGTTPLAITGEASDNSAIFTTAANNISARAKTLASIAWRPPDWNTIDQAGAGQRTPDLSAAVQQIINRNGWASGNALTIIVNGAGKRVARSYSVSTATKAPLLHIEYSIGNDTTPPSAPTSLSGTAVSQNQINLSWTASSDTVRVTGYKIFRGGSQIATTSSTSYTDAGLTAGTSYSYAVSAFDAAGNDSAQSGAVTVATPPVDGVPPSPPSGLSVNSFSSTQVNLGWGASTDNVAVSGYKVFRNGNPAAIATVTGLSYSDNGLTPSTAYSYTVSAFDAAGNNSPEAGPVTVTTLTDDAPPSIPTGLAAAAVSSMEVSLKWNAATDNLGVANYRVFRNGGPIATPAGTQYFDSGLSAGVTYTYTVAAVDSAGNASGQSASVSVSTPSSAAQIVFVGAGDIAAVTNNAARTATLFDQIVAANPAAIIYTLGDNAYQDGSAAVYASYYEPTWGRHKLRTRPAPGNHDYQTPSAQGYYDYFGALAGEAGKGYYSYNLGSWHIVSLNSEIDTAVGSPQEMWLRADLASHPSTCILAYWHKTLFTSGTVDGPTTAVRPLWQALYDYGADVILSAHEHNYERFAPQTPNGAANPAQGIRQFVAGTAGGPSNLFVFGATALNSEARNNVDFGVLKLTLNSGNYSWEFVPVAGGTFGDTGSSSCSTTLP